MIMSSYSDDIERLEALDLEGRPLWSRDGMNATVSGSRLFLASTLRATESQYSELQQIDPRTGWPINDAVYEEPFDFATEAPNDTVAVLQENSLRLLDENLQPQPPIAALGNSGSYLGRKWLYVIDDIYQGSEASQMRLSAINPPGARIMWSLELEPGQRIEQWGQHLIVVDNDSRIHGLRSTR